MFFLGIECFCWLNCGYEKLTNLSLIYYITVVATLVQRLSFLILTREWVAGEEN